MTTLSAEKVVVQIWKDSGWRTAETTASIIVTDVHAPGVQGVTASGTLQSAGLA